MNDERQSMRDGITGKQNYLLSFICMLPPTGHKPWPTLRKTQLKRLAVLYRVSHLFSPYVTTLIQDATDFLISENFQLFTDVFIPAA
jgi:hypothetical protein